MPRSYAAAYRPKIETQNEATIYNVRMCSFYGYPAGVFRSRYATGLITFWVDSEITATVFFSVFSQEISY
jgi:hypothetical protein